MTSLANLLVSLLLITTFSLAPIRCYVNRADVRVQHGANNKSVHHTYIVLVEPPPSPSPSNVDEDMYRHWYESFLPKSRDGDSGKSPLLHSYTEVFSGFAAKLTDRELNAVAKNPGFVRAFRDQTRYLMTTHTPKFLGLRKGTGIWSDADYGKGVIIGLLDSGIYAEHPSFDGENIATPPARWKGSCMATRCNNKLIGAQSFIEDDDDPSDQQGHGTHTSSTAAGNFITGASYHGMGAGTASGVAPGAHIAMYKVCADGECNDSAIVAGLDAAIKDGVDVLSLSIGHLGSLRFDKDPIAISTFSAISKGIVVVSTGGNEGPDSHSVNNDAPWLLTVGASSVDRSFDIGVNLSNGKCIHGEGLSQVAKPRSKMYPLLYSEERGKYDYMDNHVVGEKIVVCETDTTRENINNIMSAGAAGVVLLNGESNGYTIELEDYNSNVVQVSTNDGAILRAYATSTNSSAGAIFSYHNTLLGVHPAPVVASFSSRGPSIDIPGVLKPDILAPGLNILAAWSPEADPGLVYDMGITDYAGYICWLLGDEGLATFVHDKRLTCAKLPKVKDVQLNYPTITVPLKSATFVVNRTVTNVGPPASTYTVKLDVPKSVMVRVAPNKLVFSKAGEKKTFTVSVSGKDVHGQGHVEGCLSWVSAKHVVRSPIIAVPNLPESPPPLENI
ncbi:subtilisin-like protease 4 [Triticum dicoccoides]|uniref:subtilisin-like protease 4 n=1 Tax=Triticum dicoccoides TaxID=85692 RepID=UPI001891060A|nr:subtilisin-like protease 4 [Triticum dicoccoides]